MTRIAAVALAVGLSGAASASSPVLRPGGPVPDDVSVGTRTEVSAEGVVILSGGKVVGEFWLRRDVPLRAESKGSLGVALGRIEPGALLGIARFPSGWSDYKGTKVAAGVYTLRYALQPADGNHMGVSLYRDFALLLPASGDREPAILPDAKALVEGARKPVSGAHPAVLSLFAVEAGETPTLVKNELEQWMLAAKVGAVGIGFVIEGEGEH